MNRRQAGFFALGVLLVAVAIVIVGGLFDHAHTPGFDEQAVAKTAIPPGGMKAASAIVKPENKTPPPSAQSAAADTAAATPATAAAGAPAAKPSAEASAQPGPASEAQAAAAPTNAEAGGKAAASKTTEMASLAPSAATPSKMLGESPAPVAAPTEADHADGPGFDILRVEPDGSTVIAGHAEPHARIDVMSDGKTIASTQAGAIGDFVTVLDKPLAPGNYQLTLKATGKRGTKVSAEVATVSVPKDKAGDLLAMVSSPGQASRIITAPKPQAETVSAPAGTRQRPNDEAGTQLASLPSAGSAGAAAAIDKAALGPRPGSAEAVEKPGVHVDAVEVEGDKLYVAGAAKSGSTVRVYADDDLVGQATASKQGRFVVNGTRKLAIGGHTIRADLVDPATGKVTLRATVPFDRPEGAQFAAVSPQQAGSSAAAAADAGKNGGPQTIVQQPLAESDNMIIIRRGDTLWQIARRAYGYGIRYTTIYLANSDQIANPNLILPGQIFDMPQKPQKPIAQAWELHRELLSQGK